LGENKLEDLQAKTINLRSSANSTNAKRRTECGSPQIRQSLTFKNKMTIELQISSTTLLYSTKQWQLSESVVPSKIPTISVEKDITNILKGKGIKQSILLHMGQGRYIIVQAEES